MTTFNTLEEFARYAKTSPDFSPISVDEAKARKTKIAQVDAAFIYRETQCVVFGRDDHNKQKVESRIIDETFPTTPSSGAITKFYPGILERLAERHQMIEDDRHRSVDIAKGPGWSIVGGTDNPYVFVSRNLPRHIAERIASILQDHA